FVMWFLDP
ncbi:hypothetical protein CP02DC18_0733B, partial [Chlamydia psittaci 02DC18]